MNLSLCDNKKALKLNFPENEVELSENTDKEPVLNPLE